MLREAVENAQHDFIHIELEFSTRSIFGFKGLSNPPRAMTSSSTFGSCGTLQDGIVYMDLDLEEQRLLKELQETTN